MNVHLSPISSNSKTGPIPVSTTSKASCPPDCGQRSECYADRSFLGMHWSQVTSGARGTDWPTFCASIAALPDGQLWRHNQAGDCPPDDTAATLAAVNGSAAAHTYTQRELQRVAERAEAQLEQLGIPRGERPGAIVRCVSGGKVPSAYKYSRKLTSARLTRTSGGWWLTDCKLVDDYKGHETLYLTSVQDDFAVVNLRKGYRHA